MGMQLHASASMDTSVWSVGWGAWGHIINVVFLLALGERSLLSFALSCAASMHFASDVCLSVHCLSGCPTHRWAAFGLAKTLSSPGSSTLRQRVDLVESIVDQWVWWICLLVCKKKKKAPQFPSALSSQSETYHATTDVSGASKKALTAHFGARSKENDKKHTTLRIRWSSPTQLLVQPLLV
ncbi:uncharacterized protein B0H64DRAFT_50084 [Chaetomium fimeti]|uniref:Uncharacterized protein n=1 Tax=Chaetomium fimeti TaxID=1854472 RepID=A0AAE0H761_9PEZI|nr:hypothetical protein B0H64DRAFT_50084 [Chaetomium fimeti]